MRRTVLIDADISVYQIATMQEEVFEFEGRHVLHADLNDGIREFENLIGWIIDETGSDEARLMLTHPTQYRKDILETYKGQRTRKPMILPGLREHIMDEMGGEMVEGLEGDDLLGLAATADPTHTVIYSIDKDMLTVPGQHWHAEMRDVHVVGQYDADMFFYEQILTGDSVDNYKGCPGVGPVKAKKILADAVKHFQNMDGLGNDNDNLETIVWDYIVSAYLKAGLTEQDALVQARCARILRGDEFDFETGEVKLWTP